MLKRNVRFVVVLTVVAMGGLAVYRALTPTNPAAMADVQAEIRQSLPPGTARSIVQDWLTSRKIEYSVLDSSVAMGSLFEKSGLRSAEARSFIMAVMRDTSRNFPVSWSIQRLFSFDAQDLEIGALQAEIGTGP